MNKKAGRNEQFPGHFFPKEKKGVELSLNTVIIAAILIIVLVVVVTIFGRLFGKEAGQIESRIDSLDDSDGDNIINLYDRCPCQAGDRDNDGCPLGTAPPDPKPSSC